MAVRSIRLDGRRRTLLMAVGLLLAAIAVALALMQQSSRTETYLVANRDLGAGSSIQAGDFREERLSLQGRSSQYLGSVLPGQQLSSAVLAGQLLPRSAVSPIFDSTLKPLLVTPSQPLSARIHVGSNVQLWYVPKQVNNSTPSSAVQLLVGVAVLAIHQNDGTLGRAAADIELAVPQTSLPTVITAIAASGFLSVVAEG